MLNNYVRIGIQSPQRQGKLKINRKYRIIYKLLKRLPFFPQKPVNRGDLLKCKRKIAFSCFFFKIQKDECTTRPLD